MYLVEPQCCPAILEVSGVPVWDPDRVDEAAVGHGDRWGVVTPTEYVGAVELDQAPSLEDIGFAAASVNQGGHRHLTSAQYAEAEYHILRRGSGQRPRPPTRRDTHVPIEEGAIEGYDIFTSIEQRKAYRREAKLVDDFAKYLRAHGDTVSRNKLEADGVDRVFAIRHDGGKVFLPCRPEILLGLPAAHCRGRWHIVRADFPNDALSHVRHLALGDPCPTDPDGSGRCAAEDVATGSWSEVSAIVRREWPSLEAMARPDVCVPRRTPFSDAVGYD
jgi:hypothetical protein